MSSTQETFNRDLYDLLKIRGYRPIPLNSQNQRVNASQEADVIEFTFMKDGEDFGQVWISIENARSIKIYYDSQQQQSPSDKTPGLDYDDTWTGLLKHLKQWALRRQLGFELANKDRLGDDMKQREYYRKKERLGESVQSSKRPYSTGLTFRELHKLSESAGLDYTTFDRNIIKNLPIKNLPANFNTLEMFGTYARHLLETSIPDDKKNNLTPAEKTLFKQFSSRAGNTVDNVKVGDRVSLLHLSTMNIRDLKVVARLYGFLEPKEVVEIKDYPLSNTSNVKQLVFADGKKYPNIDEHDIYTITQSWNMTNLYETYDDAAKAYMFYAMIGSNESKDIQMNIDVDTNKSSRLDESYHAVNKRTSYNDAIPSVKVILQHNRNLEEGEARFRNVARIYLENVDGERFLAPTTKPGLARTFARHIAEGGLPNDERWNHIKALAEDFAKMGAFVRATRNKEFAESALQLVNEGVNHYESIRESLRKMTTHRGYHEYFESYTPNLMEEELDESINELFVQEMIDPRIESAMPILAKLRKNVSEMTEVSELDEWAESVLSEKLEMDEVKESNNPLLRAAGKSKTLRKHIPGLGRNEAGERAVDHGIDAYYVDSEELSGMSPDDEGYDDLKMQRDSSRRAAKRMRRIAKGGKPFDSSLDEARKPHPLLKAANKNMAGLASGEVQRREEQRKAAEKAQRQATKTLDRLLNKKAPKPSIDEIWRKVEDAISNYFPDGDPIDFLGPYMERNNLQWDDITRAAKKNGYKDLWDYWDTLAGDVEGDMRSDWEASGRKGPEPKIHRFHEGLDKNQKKAGQLGPTEKVGKNGPRGKLVGESGFGSDYEERNELDDLYDMDLPKPGDAVVIDGKNAIVGAETDQDAYGGPAEFEVHYEDGTIKIHSVDSILEGSSEFDGDEDMFESLESITRLAGIKNNKNG